MAITTVPLFATRGAIEPLLGEVAERQRAVLESGRYILGPEVEAFEREFAAQVGVRHCVGVANGTEALTIALRSAGVRPADEVMIPAYSFFATAEGVLNAGCVPVFCDIDPRTWTMTAATAEAALTARTRALLPVDIFGNPAPIGELAELAQASGSAVIEDAAQAAGAELDGRGAGAGAAAAGFSFYPGKNLGAFGDGGALVTDDEAIARTARRLRDHGAERKWLHLESGYNSRLDEIHAAGLRVLLPHLAAWTARRRELVAAYHAEGLAELVTLQEDTAGAGHAHHLLVAIADDRDRLIESLRARGVEARVYYDPPLHRQPALRELAGDARFPNAERLASQGVALPIGPALADDHVRRVVAAVAEAVGAP